MTYWVFYIYHQPSRHSWPRGCDSQWLEWILHCKREPRSQVKVGFPVRLAKTSHGRRMFCTPMGSQIVNLSPPGPGIELMRTHGTRLDMPRPIRPIRLIAVFELGLGVLFVLWIGSQANHIEGIKWYEYTRLWTLWVVEHMNFSARLSAYWWEVQRILRWISLGKNPLKWHWSTLTFRVFFHWISLKSDFQVLSHWKSWFYMPNLIGFSNMVIDGNCAKILIWKMWNSPPCSPCSEFWLFWHPHEKLMCSGSRTHKCKMHWLHALTIRPQGLHGLHSTNCWSPGVD